MAIRITALSSAPRSAEDATRGFACNDATLAVIGTSTSAGPTCLVGNALRTTPIECSMRKLATAKQKRLD
jgi:hypothetical protein